MMSLTRVNLMETVKKQFFFKLKANIDAFSSLIGIQLLAVLFSLGGSGSSGMFGGDLSVNVKYYTSDIVIVFTMIWSLVTAITITTKPYRNHDFTFVTNRLSSSLSNILFLLVASIIGSITSILSGNLIKMFPYIYLDQQGYSVDSGIEVFLLGAFAAFLYLFIVSSIGYLIGALVQKSKGFVVLIPVLFFGSLFLDATLGREWFLLGVFQFYFMESTFSLFIVKVILTAALFFAAAAGILNRMEVRR